MQNTITKKEATRMMIYEDLSSLPMELFQKMYSYSDIELLNYEYFDEEQEEYCEFYSMWNYVWLITQPSVEEKIINNLEYVCNELGFYVYQDYENGYLWLGINGAGYDFYEKHWIPLYDFLGYHWHTEEKGA